MANIRLQKKTSVKPHLPTTKFQPNSIYILHGTFTVTDVRTTPSPPKKYQVITTDVYHSEEA
uniref:Uncharacterized protein n=1 Tax=Arion vulgaris TaxID=1028688 RepID=A0A0B7AIN3_9EUPU